MNLKAGSHLRNLVSFVKVVIEKGIDVFYLRWQHPCVDILKNIVENSVPKYTRDVIKRCQK